MIFAWLAPFFLFSALFAESSYWDASLVRSYVHSSELQRRWAVSFLAPYLKTLGGDERILDIGCGDGKITADLSRFVPNGAVLGIDPSSAMTGWAARQFHSVEYPNLSFAEGSFLDPGKIGAFDWVVSFCALQHCPSIPLAIENARSLLKPGGRLLILVPALTNAAWNQARAAVQKRPRWQLYWQNIPPRKFLSVEQYEELFAKAGFRSFSIRPIETRDPFVDREELLVWLEGTFTPAVPIEERRAFYEEWIDEYLRLDPEAIGLDGVLYCKMGTIWIEALH